MTTPNFSGGIDVATFYGAGPHRILAMTLLGGGSGKALAVPPVSAVAGTVVPCASEIVSCAYTTTGSYVLTFAGNHYAIAYMHASVDDINAATPVGAFLGQATSLGTGTPLTLVLSTYATGGGGSAADVALNTPVRILIHFKDDNTGAAA